MATEVEPGCLGVGAGCAAGCLSLIEKLFVAITLLTWWGTSLRPSVDEHWPEGQTRSIRVQAEAVLPPPSGAVFVDAHRFAGPNDGPLYECLSYESQAPWSELDAYYRELLEARGWSIHEEFAWEGGTELVTVQVPGSQSWDGRVSYRRAAGHGFQVCSRSWQEVLRHMKQPSARSSAP